VRRPRIIFPALLSLIVCSTVTAGSHQKQTTRSVTGAETFEPLERWKRAVLAGDSAALTAMYSSDPPAQIVLPGNKTSTVNEDVAFWCDWKRQGLTALRITMAQPPGAQQDPRVIVFEVELTLRTAQGNRKYYVPLAQAWKQQVAGWQLVALQRQAPARLRQPLAPQNLCSPDAIAKADIAAALTAATKTHKRVLLVFGGNWCYDCHVLDAAFHSPEIAPQLEKSFEVVDVDIGRMDKNLDIAKQYDIPLDRGVPAIAVLDSAGKLLFSQKRGEFEAARSMAPEDILEFLNKWKPRA
jgi:hypothetical protein